MNNRIAKCAALAILLVATLAAPICAAADDWSRDRVNHRYHHHDRDDSVQWKQRDWRKEQHEVRKEQRKVRKHADRDYSSVTSSQNYATYNPYAPYSAFNSGNYLQSGAAAVRSQLLTGYANLQNAYANALASGDRNGAQHYLNGLKQQQKEMAQYNATWGSTAGSISIPASPVNSFGNYPIYPNNAIYPNSALFPNTAPGLTPYNTAQIDPRLGAATALLLMGQQVIHP